MSFMSDLSDWEQGKRRSSSILSLYKFKKMTPSQHVNKQYTNRGSVSKSAVSTGRKHDVTPITFIWEVSFGRLLCVYFCVLYYQCSDEQHRQTCTVLKCVDHNAFMLEGLV